MEDSVSIYFGSLLGGFLEKWKHLYLSLEVMTQNAQRISWSKGKLPSADWKIASLNPGLDIFFFTIFQNPKNVSQNIMRHCPPISTRLNMYVLTLVAKASKN